MLVYTLRGDPWPPGKRIRRILLSQRDVILGSASCQNRWRRISRNQKEEIIRQNHPGRLSTLESFWWDFRRGITGFALLDRSLLQEIRRRLGERVLIFLPLSVSITHSDGIKEECWITEDGEPQVALLPVSGGITREPADQKPFLVKKAFPSPLQMKRTFLTRALLSGGSLVLFCFLVLNPWMRILGNHHDFLMREVNEQERLARVREWEKSLTGENDSEEPLISEPGLGFPWSILEDLSLRTSSPLGIEVFHLGKSQFRIRLWGEDFHDLTRSLSGDPRIIGLEFAEYPEEGVPFGEPGLLSLSLTGGYLHE